MIWIYKKILIIKKLFIRCYEVNQCTIYPYANISTNSLRFSDQIRPIQFPDVSPFEFTNDKFQFSMAAGDFLEIYNENGLISALKYYIWNQIDIIFKSRWMEQRCHLFFYWHST